MYNHYTCGLTLWPRNLIEIIGLNFRLLSNFHCMPVVNISDTALVIRLKDKFASTTCCVKWNTCVAQIPG